MPFGFLKRRKDAEAARAGNAPAPVSLGGSGLAFDGLKSGGSSGGCRSSGGCPMRSTSARRSDRRRHGRRSTGRPSSSRASGLRSVDYDLILVIAGDDSLPPLTDAEREAFMHSISYDVALEVPPFRVIGTVHLYPGSEPDRLLDRATEMFVPVVDAVAYLGEQQVTSPDVDAVLVNRFYLRGVEQVDKRTGVRHQRLPGAPLGGVSYSDRSSR